MEEESTPGMAVKFIYLELVTLIVIQHKTQVAVSQQFKPSSLLLVRIPLIITRQWKEVDCMHPNVC